MSKTATIAAEWWITQTDALDPFAAALFKSLEEQIERVKPTRITTTTQGNVSPVLTGAFSNIGLDRNFALHLCDHRRSMRIDWQTGEIAVERGFSGKVQILAPDLIELDMGTTLEKLIAAINAANKRIWIVELSATLRNQIIGSGPGEFCAVMGAGHVEFWLKLGIRPNVVENMRPQGPLLLDLTYLGLFENEEIHWRIMGLCDNGSGP